MKKYLLIRSKGHWRLKKYGASRALINFGNRRYGEDFDQVLSATMTYADDMGCLVIMNDNGTVRYKLGEGFISLYRREK